LRRVVVGGISFVYTWWDWGGLVVVGRGEMQTTALIKVRRDFSLPPSAGLSLTRVHLRCPPHS